MLKSLLGIARQWSREKFAILSLKPRSHNRILTYPTWAINASLLLSYAADFSKMQPNIVFSHNLVPRFSLLPVSYAQIGENPGTRLVFSVNSNIIFTVFQ